MWLYATRSPRWRMRCLETRRCFAPALGHDMPGIFIRPCFFAKLGALGRTMAPYPDLPLTVEAETAGECTGIPGRSVCDRRGNAPAICAR